MAPVTMAIEMGRRRLRAVLARRHRNVLRVERVLSEEIRRTSTRVNPAALGEWIRQQLRAARFPRGRAIVALAREHVGLKRFSLPSTDANELPNMTRLALQRDLPFADEKAVIDFVPVSRTETTTTVLAVAVPERICDHAMRTMKAAGIRVERLTLRAMGCAAVLRSLASEHKQSVLALDVSGDGVEFCVLENDQIRLSRAAELPQQPDPVAISDAIVTEARRTWMSFRMTETNLTLQLAVIIGDSFIEEYAKGPLQELLQAPVEQLEGHPLIDRGGERLTRVWPLVGLLLEPVLGTETIDFSRPRRFLDPRLAQRRRAVLGAAAVVLILLAGWSYARRETKLLNEQLGEIEAQRASLAPDFARRQREQARLLHLDQWSSVDPRWLEHIGFLLQNLPPREDIVLDGITASIHAPGVQYRKKDGSWTAPRELAIVIEGEARDRAIADALRARLVHPDWMKASSSGSDGAAGRRLPFGFTYRLTTGEVAPLSEKDSESAEKREESASP